MRPSLRVAPLLLALGCGVPADPEGTTARVLREGVRVGVSADPPWVRRAAPEAHEPRGVAVELVRELAAELGAPVRWRWGVAEELLRALERRELDLALVGLHADSTWRGRVALTRPFHTERVRIGAPPGAELGGDLAGREVAVEAGKPWAAAVADAGARPRRVERPFESGLPVAAPEWELAAHGYGASGPVLETRERVLAVPPGENAWLATVERFLARRAGRVERRLAEGGG